MQNAQIVLNTKFSPATLQNFAKLAVVNPAVAMATLLGLASPEDLIDGLVPFPGALMALYRCDECPRALKASFQDALELSGHQVLT